MIKTSIIKNRGKSSGSQVKKTNKDERKCENGGKS